MLITTLLAVRDGSLQDNDYWQYVWTALSVWTVICEENFVHYLHYVQYYFTLSVILIPWWKAGSPGLPVVLLY